MMTVPEMLRALPEGEIRMTGRTVGDILADLDQALKTEPADPLGNEPLNAHALLISKVRALTSELRGALRLSFTIPPVRMIREVSPKLLEDQGIKGRWRWKDGGERIAAGDFTDFPTPTELAEMKLDANRDRTRFRGVVDKEIGYNIMADEDVDVMTPIPADGWIDLAFDSGAAGRAMKIQDPNREQVTGIGVWVDRGDSCAFRIPDPRAVSPVVSEFRNALWAQLAGSYAQLGTAIHSVISEIMRRGEPVIGNPQPSITEGDEPDSFMVRPMIARLEFKVSDLTLEGVYAGDYSLVTDGVIWGVGYKGSHLEGSDWLHSLEEGIKHFARAIAERRTK